MVHFRSAVRVLLAAGIIVSAAPFVAADDAWNPFAGRPERPLRGAPQVVDDRPALPPMNGRLPDRSDGWTARAPSETGGARGSDGRYDDRPPAGRYLPPPWESRPRLEGPQLPPSGPAIGGATIERTELAPVGGPAAQTGAVPGARAGDSTDVVRRDAWRDLDIKAISEHVSRIAIPLPTASTQKLWKSLWMSDSEPPAGAPSESQFLALRLEALFRSGYVAEMAAVLARRADPSGDPLIDVIRRRMQLALGQSETACAQDHAARNLARELTPRLRQEAILMNGYCAAAAGNTTAASLAAQLAREEGLEEGIALQTLEALAAGTKPELTRPTKVTLLDYKFLTLAGNIDLTPVLSIVEPAVLASVALDDRAAPGARLAAGEVAAAGGIISPERLADLYIAAGAAGASAQQQRALPFVSQQSGAAPAIREAWRMGHGLSYLAALNRASTVRAGPQLPMDIAIEAALAADDDERLRRFGFGDRAVVPSYWTALLGIATGARGDRLDLRAIEELGALGQLSPAFLHRLVTVLDALAYDVPIRLWDLASRTAQPTEGHLPETGVLAELKASASTGAHARTVLLVLRTIGPRGPDGAHMLALGDAIRALRRIGLEREARRVAVEALLPSWPRASRS